MSKPQKPTFDTLGGLSPKRKEVRSSLGMQYTTTIKKPVAVIHPIEVPTTTIVARNNYAPCLIFCNIFWFITTWVFFGLFLHKYLN